MYRKNFLLFSFALFNFLFTFSQQEKVLTLEQVLNKVEDNNQAIKIAQQDYKSAKGDFNQTNSVFLPSVSVSHTGIATTNPLMAFGSKLNQEIVTPLDFDPTLLNNPNQIKSFSTKIEVLQPIFNGDGIYIRKAAKAKMNAFELQTERTKEYMVLEVKKAYMQLQVAYKAVEVLEKAFEASLENKKVAENYYKQGYLNEAELLAVDVHVTEITNQLNAVTSNVKNASDYLNFLMGETQGELITPSVELKPQENLNILSATISNTRADIEAMEKSTEAFKNMHNSNKYSYLPRLNAFGTYELHDNDIFGTEAKGYLVGAQLTFSVFEGYKRIGKIQKSKAELEKAKISLEQYKNQSELEFNKAKRQLIDAKNALKLNKLAVEQSQEALRIRTNRFKQGLEKTSDLLIAQTQALQKELEYLQTVFNYNFTEAYVTFLSN